MRLGALLMASAAKSLVVLPRAEWAARAAAHRTRVADLLFQLGSGRCFPL